MGLGNVTENVRDVNDNAKKYIDSSIEFYKLSFFKKFMKATVILSMSLLLGAIAFMAILIFSIAIARNIGQAVGDIITGFYIMGGIYVLLMVLVYVFFKRPLEKLLLKKFSDIFFEDEKDFINHRSRFIVNNLISGR